ncbi:MULTISPECIES: cytochrome c biogenesis protein ResB [unclassified Herbaspirillum]|uniref:cytochrome c biogenesis protein ResB n=1 Tax=unclassified Herbaspirillum TaxID=2624150 RepID=UPI0011549980|nr:MULTISPECIES: cytochrome c biogenesis protein ResB [unclassified Herbaspirillum]MBB5393691.1 cytochrome c biogenesis protein [Herbaspirillum sp. SJZ102]TQK01447.1 cytochrome c biogenesis protein [Herbaspirillum sp. SJZ130]TQK05843.1 cytochrome c biogenesis protein [Herbaspirillum sp. SJZ106]
MTTGSSTEGILIRTRQRWVSDAVELVSSMRFAISLLTLIAVASVIGTVMKQNEPMPNYVNQFGPFWFEVFNKLGLYAVYSAWWFLLIMGFLVLSTSLCIARNAPKMLRDVKSWRDNVREQSLRNFHHKAEWRSAEQPAQAAARLARQVGARGYKVKLVDKDGGTLLAAKQGAANKWGYIFAHAAIVIICLGGLLDSDLPIRFQQWFYGKQAFSGNGIISQIPERYRLGIGNPTFRGNTLIPEGASSSTAIIPQQDGVMIQDLPFTIQLKRFIIDFYSTGMPKLFASEVVVRDHETGHEIAATIKVNEPLIYKNVAIYQSSFEDGGTRLKLVGYPMRGAENNRFDFAGEVNGSTPLAQAAGDYTVEWTGFRPFNVENMNSAGNGAGGAAGGDARAVNIGKTVNQGFMGSLDKHLGSGAKNANNKDFKNVGPSIQYKLRDKTGQAREYFNYMQSMQIDGAYVFLAGMREQPDQPFRYLRIPADDNDSVVEWMRLRAALANPALREEAARRYARQAISGGRDTPAALREQLQQSAQRGLDIFAGDGKTSGFIAVTRFLEKLPAAEQEKAADIFMKILNGSMWELWQAARAKDGLAPVASDEVHGRYLQLAINALADAAFYPAPVFLQLSGFEEIKASVLQVTRSPGKKVVYLGCLLLVLGVFAMLYIRERRLWIWIKPQEGGRGSHALLAMSTQRKTLDFEKEFEQMKAGLAPAADSAS